MIDDVELAHGWIITFATLSGVVVGLFVDGVVDRVPQRLAAASAATPGAAGPGGQSRARGFVGSRRAALISLVTGAVFGLVAWGSTTQIYPPMIWPLMLYWAAVAVALAFIDVAHHRLPNAIVLPSYGVTLALLVLACVATGEYGRLLAAGVGMLALGGFYALLAFVRPGGMGLGDVKLAGVLGMLLAWLGWGPLIVGTLAGFVLGGVAGLVLIAARRATSATAIPFGPFMLAGAAIGIGWGGALAQAALPAAGVG